jgi:folate-dependent phosphoribosylglycinamide formyltransferase PurN
MADAFPIAVLISGRGTNLAAIHQAISTGALGARIVAVC